MLTDIVPSKFRSLAPWRRRDDFLDMQRNMSRLMRDFFDEDVSLLSPFEWSEGAANFVPRLDLQETEDRFTISAELPGLTENDVEVAVDKDCLSIKGEKKEEKHAKTAGRSFSERRYGAFQRNVQLPSWVDKDKISAKFDKGVLVVDLPKTAEAKHEVKKIAIKH